jgi:ABC-2 type transport system ATP-binding protein
MSPHDSVKNKKIDRSDAPQGLYGANAVEVRDLIMRFGPVTALENLNLTIGPGELFGLLGPNGAGKTTLISILATMLRATSGEAAVYGYDVTSDQDLVRGCIGIVFQDPSLDEELTATENLDLHGRLYGLAREFRQERTAQVLELVDLSERGQDKVKSFSGGMRRRLEIARGLMHTPKLLFLDEPTLGLDPQTRRRIWDYIRLLRTDEGTTIILTTHYMDEADSLCDRIAIIDRGSIVALGSPRELKASMGGDVVEMILNDPVEAFIEELKMNPNFSKVETDSINVRLSAEHGSSSLPLIFRIASENKAEIASVSVRTPNLEDVFLKLTGRTMRDEEAVESRDRMRLYMAPRRR